MYCPLLKAIQIQWLVGQEEGEETKSRFVKGEDNLLVLIGLILSGL